MLTPLLTALLLQVFVAPHGDDRGPGSLSQPFATLQRAQQEVRQLRAQNPKRGVTVLIRAGVYSLSQPLEFHAADGGDAQRAVLWASMPGERVILSGGIEVNGWSEERPDVYRAPLPPAAAGRPVRHLYWGQQRLPRARFPNRGWLRVGQAGADRRTSFSFDGSAVPPVEGVGGMEVFFLHDWSSSRIPVASLDLEKGLLQTRSPIGCAASHYAIDHFEPHPRFALEGRSEWIDSPGEWCQDPVTGDLLLAPPQLLPEDPNARADLSRHGPTVPLTEQLLRVVGTAERPVRNLHFSGLEWQCTSFSQPVDGWAGAQASMHERRDGSAQATARVFDPAALQMEYARDCSLSRCTMRAFGGSGVWIGRGCQDILLQQCRLRNIASNGINIGEDGSRQVDGAPWWKKLSPDSTELCQRITVEACAIEAVGQRHPGAVGIWLGFAADCRLAFNELRNMPYTGISVGWVWAQDPSPCRGHLIEHNDISRVMQLLSDGGCIYTLGRQPGTILRNNHLHDVARQAGRAPSNGIFLDEGSSEIVVSGNLIRGIAEAPIRFHRAGAVDVVGNVLISERQDPYQFNRTDPTLIQSRDNQLRPTMEKRSDFEIIENAGIEGFHRARAASR